MPGLLLGVTHDVNNGKPTCQSWKESCHKGEYSTLGHFEHYASEWADQSEYSKKMDPMHRLI